MDLVRVDPILFQHTIALSGRSLVPKAIGILLERVDGNRVVLVVLADQLQLRRIHFICTLVVPLLAILLAIFTVFLNHVLPVIIIKYLLKIDYGSLLRDDRLRACR